MVLARVAFLIGAILRWFGLALLVPAVVAVFDANRTEVLAFVVSAAASTGVGLLLHRVGEAPLDLRRPDALAVVAFTYLALGLAGALPYLFVGLMPIDALFESMSGLTTTGATVLTDFSRYGRAIHFWRALSHWLGGMGVITLFVAVLPKLAIGGRDLFFAEASGPTDDALTPQIRKTAAALWWVYTALTAVAMVALLVAGLPPYDAIVHAFATVAAGGFSPHPQSVMGYQRPAVEWTVTFFMFLAGANFALHYRAILTRSTRIFRDEELVAYIAIVVLASAAVTGFLVTDGGHRVAEALRLATFQVVSVITSTGFATADYATWDDRSRALLLALMFMGGCAGSAAGGLKIVRVLLICALRAAGAAPHAPSPRGAAGEAERTRRAGTGDAVGAGVLSLLSAGLRGLRRPRDGGRRRHHDRRDRGHRRARQRRPRVRRHRADGQLRRPDRRQQGRPHAGDVAWPPRADDGARLSRSTGVARRAVEQPRFGRRILIATVSDGSPSTLARRS